MPFIGTVLKIPAKIMTSAYDKEKEKKTEMKTKI